MAREAAAPPEDPPAFSFVSQGFSVGPKTSLKVFPPAPNSGVFVLPSTIPPRASRRSTRRSLLSGMKSEKPRLPYVVRTPATSFRSLIVIGKPPSHPGWSHSFSCSDATEVLALSSQIVGVAFINGPVCDTLFSAASINSVGETSPLCSISTTSCAS